MLITDIGGRPEPPLYGGGSVFVPTVSGIACANPPAYHAPYHFPKSIDTASDLGYNLNIVRIV